MGDFDHLDPVGGPLRRKAGPPGGQLRQQNGDDQVRPSGQDQAESSSQARQSHVGTGEQERAPRDRDAGVVEAQRGDGSSVAATASNKPAIQRPQLKRPTFNAVLVNGCQRGNPLLQHIRNVAWEYGDIVPDYQVGASNCILFLSLRYHRLHPEYVHTRVTSLGQMYTLRVLLVMCDVDHHQEPIKELTKIGIVNNLTLIVAWSAAEAGRYIESYKALEHKPPDMIRERPETDYISLLTQSLTNIRGVNKTDVMTLISNFGSLKQLAEVIRDRPHEIAMCPGFGDLKSKRLIEAFETPFLVRNAKKRPRTG